jgi:hypothetical protein
MASLWQIAAILSIGTTVGAGHCNSEVAAPMIDGFIDRQFYINLKEIIESGHREIRLQSPGGDESIALDAGSLIAENRMRVTVTGVCASSCSQFLLPFAESITIEPQAVIAMHANSFGMVEEGYVSTATPSWSIMEANHRKTKDVFSRYGVSPEFLSVATRASHPLCYLPPIEKGRRERMLLEYSLWVPAIEDLLSFGWSLDANIDPAAVQTRTMANRSFVSTARLRFSRPDDKDYAKEIRPCEIKM